MCRTQVRLEADALYVSKDKGFSHTIRLGIIVYGTRHIVKIQNEHR
jgi:hypothetical protein